jgi:hypothetical protein
MAYKNNQLSKHSQVATKKIPVSKKVLESDSSYASSSALNSGVASSIARVSVQIQQKIVINSTDSVVSSSS